MGESWPNCKNWAPFLEETITRICFTGSSTTPRTYLSCSLLLLIFTHSVPASILHPFLLVQPSPGEAESSKLQSHPPLHAAGSQLHGSKGRTIQQNSHAFAKPARSVFMMVGPCWCLGACYFSVPSLPLLDRVSSSGRCWDTSGSLVKAMAAEEDQEHAAIFQFRKTSHKEELAVSVEPCSCRHQTALCPVLLVKLGRDGGLNP